MDEDFKLQIDQIPYERPDNEDDFEGWCEWQDEYIDPLRDVCSEAEKYFGELVNPSISDGFKFGLNRGFETLSVSDACELRCQVPNKLEFDKRFEQVLYVHKIFYMRLNGWTEFNPDSRMVGEYNIKCLENWFNKIRSETKNQGTLALWI